MINSCGLLCAFVQKYPILKGVPVTSLRKWMGHAQLETTAIYVDAVGSQQQEIAARMWE